MAITVSQLNKYIKTLLETDINLSRVSVCGEISNFKLHSSGHCYMTLKDEGGAVRAVMFKSYASKLKFVPENGMKVIASGKISLYERDGQYQLYISSMQPDGIGDLHVAYEQLKERLRQEGLFDAAHKKPIPRFPQTIGVITSHTGAAVRDIINVSTRRFPLAEIFVCPVLVQGDGSAAQIVSAIEFINRTKAADVIILGRGGGSIEDLWSFNEEAVAYAIYNSDIPVISAVGHETDFTIADFVADLRAPTPSAAAELAVPSALDIKAKMHEYCSRMYSCIRKDFDYKKRLINSFSVKSPMDAVNQNRLRTDNAVQKILKNSTLKLSGELSRLDSAVNRMNKYMNEIFSEKEKKLAVLSARLDALSPLKVMTRGYCSARSECGTVTSVKQVKPGSPLGVRVSDGMIECTVNKTERLEKNG